MFNNFQQVGWVFVLFCFVWVWFVCIVCFVFVGFGSSVCLFVFNFSPAFFLVAEINVTSFQDKLFGIANQRSLFCCWSQVFSWVCATIGSETVALHSQTVLWRSHGEWETPAFLSTYCCSQGNYVIYGFIIFCGLTQHETKGGLFFLWWYCCLYYFGTSGIKAIWNIRSNKWLSN